MMLIGDIINATQSQKVSHLGSKTDINVECVPH